MNGAPLVSRFFARPKQCRSVERTRFVIAPDTHASASTFHLRKSPFAEYARIGSGRIGAEKCAAHTKIEDHAGRRAQIYIEHRGCRLRVVAEPFPQRFALRNGVEPASLTKRVVRKALMDLCQPRE